MAKSAAKTVSTEAPKSFEAAMQELEKLVDSLESGELSLELALAAHRRGLELAKYCNETLTKAEADVKILEGELLKAFPTDEPEDEPDDDSE
jgi:exodeoxyribonuclease VII small subunit